MKIWSGEIGSDITFFFSSGTAYCTGRGEIIESHSQPPLSESLKVHVFKPLEGLSTKLVFQALDIKTMCSPSDPKELLEMFTQYGALKAASMGGLENDLESPAFKCSPSLLKLKGDISEIIPRPSCEGEECGIGDLVMMSGSGTSIYALTDATRAVEDSELQRSVSFSHISHILSLS